MTKRLTFAGSTLRPRSDQFKADVARDLEERVWPHFPDGPLRTLTHSTFPLAQAEEAFEEDETEVGLEVIEHKNAQKKKKAIADFFPNCTIIFADIVGFSKFSFFTNFPLLAELSSNRFLFVSFYSQLLGVRLVTHLRFSSC